MSFLLGMPANEIVIPIAAMAYLSTGTIAELGNTELHALLLQNGWTPVTALCTVLFSLFHWPCSTTCLTIHRETGSLRWTLAAIALPQSSAFLCAFWSLLPRVCWVFHRKTAPSKGAVFLVLGTHRPPAACIE